MAVTGAGRLYLLTLGTLGDRFLEIVSGRLRQFAMCGEAS
jgi:hypothetical protein